VERDIYKKVRKDIPPHDYEFESSNKKRYSRSDRYEEKKEIEEGIQEYIREEET